MKGVNMKKNKPQTIEEWLEAIYNETAAMHKLLEEKFKTGTVSLTDLGLIDTHELCRMLNVSYKTAASWRKAGKIRFTQLGSRYYYLLNDIKAMLMEGFDRK